MSKIFELYGYRLSHWTPEAERNLARAWCPFMDAECDGGGNRYQSAIDLSRNASLQQRIPNKKSVQCGVCSLQLRDGAQPWIVCPRRILGLTRGGLSRYQSHVRQGIAALAQLELDRPHGIWSEVKIKAASETAAFDYAFDYIIAGTRPVKVAQLASEFEMSPATVKRLAERNGYTLGLSGAELQIDDFPCDPMVIIEVMTSSTSGGNKRLHSQIAMAFEDALLNNGIHTAPGINYRQVWARMVSQLIAKSQIGLAWNGHTIWLIQDVLAEYISKSTALRLPDYLSDCLDEVNILSLGYGEGSCLCGDNGEPLELNNSCLYSGKISAKSSLKTRNGFVDIIKINTPPPKTLLWKALLGKRSSGSWQP